MSISKRERRSPRPGDLRPDTAPATLPAPPQGVPERLVEAIASQDKLFLTLRSYPLEAGDEPAVVFRP